MLSLVAIIAIILLVFVTKKLFMYVKLENILRSSLIYILMCDISAVLVLTCCLISYYNVDERIATLQQENTAIEETTYSALQYYLEHEENNYKDLEIEKKDTMIVISLFPEVEAIVHGNVEKYNENLEALKKLQESKENIPTLRWLLYFGS